MEEKIWYHWQDVPFEEYLHNESDAVPGVIVCEKILGWEHHVQSLGNESDTMAHLKMVCGYMGEGNYVITPKKVSRRKR